jgi:hypothetical protein
MTDTESVGETTTETASPLVTIGEFWVNKAGLFKAYLPEDPERPQYADVDSEHITLSQVHPEVIPHVATVPHLGADAKWETAPDWSTQAAEDALAKCRQLRRVARLRAGREP